MIANDSSPDPLALGTRHRRFLIIETLINGVISGVLSAGFAWMVFGGRDPIPFWGVNGLAFDLVPTVFMITLMMTLGLTVVTRMRCSSGGAPLLGGRNRLPKNVLLRSVVLALTATLMLVPLSVALLALFAPESWSFSSVLLFKIIYGIALAMVITPMIVMGAMRDIGSQR